MPLLMDPPVLRLIDLLMLQLMHLPMLNLMRQSECLRMLLECPMRLTVLRGLSTDCWMIAWTDYRTIVLEQMLSKILGNEMKEPKEKWKE